MNIAFIGALQPASVLPEECIAPRYRKHAHPAPWISGLLPELAKLTDFRLRVFLPHRSVVRPCVVERDGVEYEGVPCRMLERFAPHTLFYSKSLAVAGAIRRFQPDLIHAFGLENGSATIALRQRRPVSSFIQGIAERLSPFYGNHGALHKRLAVACERRAVRRARWMVAETRFAKDWALGHNPDAHLALIPHPLRPAFLEVRSSPQPGRIIALGSLDHFKGMDTVLRAFAGVRNPQARLCIVGGGPCAAQLSQLAATLGVAGRIEFCGTADTPRVIGELARSTVFAIGSRMDTSPNVVTEAHAVGLPVIGTRAGGIPEMIEDGGDGFHVDVDDHLAMAEKLDLLLGDPDLARRMGAAGREKVRVLNDPVRIAQAHVEFFTRIGGDLQGLRNLT